MDKWQIFQVLKKKMQDRENQQYFDPVLNIIWHKSFLNQGRE